MRLVWQSCQELVPTSPGRAKCEKPQAKPGGDVAQECGLEEAECECRYVHLVHIQPLRGCWPEDGPFPRLRLRFLG